MPPFKPMNKRTFLKLGSAVAATPILSPLLSWAAGEKLKNWAGNFEFSTEDVTPAKSLEQVQQYVKSHEKLKALGTRHCFNQIANSKFALLEMKPLDHAISIDENERTVTVEPGMSYGQLAPYLDSKGWALHNLASLPHISVAGSCATATHGSGDNNGNLSSAVAALEMVTASGDVSETVAQVRRRKVPRRRRSSGRARRGHENHAQHSADLSGAAGPLRKSADVRAERSFRADHGRGVQRQPFHRLVGSEILRGVAEEPRHHEREIHGGAAILWRHARQEKHASDCCAFRGELHRADGRARTVVRPVAALQDGFHAERRQRIAVGIFRPAAQRGRRDHGRRKIARADHAAFAHHGNPEHRERRSYG